MGTEHARKASALEVSVQGVMQDQGWYGQSWIALNLVSWP